MKRYSLALIWCMASMLVAAQTSELHTVVQQLLSQDANHQKLVIRLHQEQAHHSLEGAVSGLELSARYQQYDNDVERDELEETLEQSTIAEEDTRYQVELSKQLFPMDFDTTEDALKHQLAIHRYQQEVAISMVESTTDILDDCIQWWEATQMLPVLQQRNDVLAVQWQVLQQQSSTNVAATELLIDQLQEIDDCAEKLLKYQKNKAEAEARYGDSITEVFAALQRYSDAAPLPDSLGLTTVQRKWNQQQQNSAAAIQRTIRWSTIPVFLPQIDLTLGYHWRTTSQDWDITEDGTTTFRSREQTEVYPEIGVELSIPLDLWNSTRSKKRLLNQYSRELHFRDSEITTQYTSLLNEITTEYHTLRQAVQRKKLLAELYAREATALLQMAERIPSELASQPAIAKAQMESEKARIALQKARLQLFKTVFLWEYLHEDQS